MARRRLGLVRAVVLYPVAQSAGQLVARDHRCRDHLLHLRHDLLSLAHMPARHAGQRRRPDRLLRAGDGHQVLGRHPRTGGRGAAHRRRRQPIGEAAYGGGDLRAAGGRLLRRGVGGLRIPVRAEPVAVMGIAPRAPVAGAHGPHPCACDGVDRCTPSAAEHVHGGIPDVRAVDGPPECDVPRRRLQHGGLVVLLPRRLSDQDADRLHRVDHLRARCRRAAPA